MIYIYATLYQIQKTGITNINLTFYIIHNWTDGWEPHSKDTGYEVDGRTKNNRRNENDKISKERILKMSNDVLRDSILFVRT